VLVELEGLSEGVEDASAGSALGASFQPDVVVDGDPG
jgi:hypothetical protein